MKVIDLLNKIANDDYTNYDEKIKLENEILTIGEFLSSYIFNTKRLNDEVRIKVEDKKIPEKIETYDIDGDIFIDDRFFKYMPIDKHHLTANEQVFVDKINEIIDYLEENI